MNCRQWNPPNLCNLALTPPHLYITRRFQDVLFKHFTTFPVLFCHCSNVSEWAFYFEKQLKLLFFNICYVVLMLFSITYWARVLFLFTFYTTSCSSFFGNTWEYKCSNLTCTSTAFKGSATWGNVQWCTDSAEYPSDCYIYINRVLTHWCLRWK